MRPKPEFSIWPSLNCLDPRHGGVEPDRQRAAALERLVIGGPVPGLVDRGCRSAHAVKLPRWIHEMNPPSHLRNKAGMDGFVAQIR